MNESKEVAVTVEDEVPSDPEPDRGVTKLSENSREVDDTMSSTLTPSRLVASTPLPVARADDSTSVYETPRGDSRVLRPRREIKLPSRFEDYEMY